MSETHPQAFGERVLRLLVDTVEDYALCALDLEGRVIRWNAGFQHTTGFTESEVLGQPLDIIFTIEDREAGLPLQELRLAEKQGRAEDERWHVRKNGSRFWAMGIVVPVRDEAGLLVGFGKIMRDRTDIKEVQDTLRHRATALTQADVDKNIFIATLAHELRNPLANIQSAVELMRRTTDPRVQQLSEAIRRQVAHSSRLIEDLLEIARIGREKVQLTKRPTDLSELAAQACDMVSATIRERAQQLQISAPIGQFIVAAEHHRLLQVFVNLLNNASKFTHSGGHITISATSEGESGVVRVVDDGAGIAPDKLESIFDLFSQAHSALPGSQAGLGIGLALARDLVTLHEGTIQARSHGAGKGSEFIVRIPLLIETESIHGKLET